MPQPPVQASGHGWLGGGSGSSPHMKPSPVVPVVVVSPELLVSPTVVLVIIGSVVGSIVAAVVDDVISPLSLDMTPVSVTSIVVTLASLVIGVVVGDEVLGPEVAPLVVPDPAVVGFVPPDEVSPDSLASAVPESLADSLLEPEPSIGLPQPDTIAAEAPLQTKQTRYRSQPARDIQRTVPADAREWCAPNARESARTGAYERV